MGLLLSVLIGCFGVLELLACLRHATSGVPLADEKSPPCLFYHHFDSANFSSHDCICNISHSSQTSFPTSVKQKLENLHEYSLRVRNDLRSLGDHYEWTLSDFSTRDLFGASRPDSRLGDDFADETSDVKTKSGLKMRNEVFLPSEFNSYEMSLTPISFKLENCKLSSYSFNKNVEMSSINDSENQTLKNLFLEYKDSERYFHYAKSYQNSPGISNNERKNVSKCPSKIDSSRWADDMFPKKNQKKTSKNTAKLICINAKKYLDEDRGPSDVAIQTSSDLLEDKYSKNEYSSSNRKSVPVQTSFEEKISEDDTLHGLKSNLNFKNSAGRIHGNENVSFWKIESNELSSFRKKSSVNNGKSRKCENLFDCGIQDKKELNSELKKSANNWEDLTTNGKVFNNSEPFDKYMDAKGEDIMTLERRITSPIKYAVPDAGENHAFWVNLLIPP